MDNIPFVLVGGGLNFKMGRSIKYPKTPHNALLMAIAHGFGVTFTASSAHSGNWSDPKHMVGWGACPSSGILCRSRSGDSVTYDVSSDAAIRMIHVAGEH